MGPYLNNAVTANEINVAQVAVNWREHRNQRENQSQPGYPNTRATQN